MIHQLLSHFYDLADWSSAAAAYVRKHGLSTEAIYAHAGVFAIVPCTFNDNGSFALDENNGEPAAVIECLGEDAETIEDLVAWPVNKPEIFATALGADALGKTNVTNPATWFDTNVLQVHRTPLAWLAAGCRGCVVLDHRHVPCWLGQALGAIAAEDLEHGEQLYRWLNPRFDKRRILVPKTFERRAA